MVYTKEQRIANLAKAREARKKKMKGRGITSTADTAIGTAIGKGITSQADTAVGTAEGKGYYTQDYVPSDQLNFAGNPLDNMDYSKIRARREDKRKKGEYTYSKEMAVNDMPIPTVSGDGYKKRNKKYVKIAKHKLKHHNTYEENLVEDGYLTKLATLPQQYTRLMNGSGWNDFVRGLRSVENAVMSGVNLLNTGAQAYDTYNRINRATPSSMPMGRVGRREIPNEDYNQTLGFTQPDDDWLMVEHPLSDRPNRRTTSIAHREAIPPHYNEIAYSDRPAGQRRITSNIPVERIEPSRSLYEQYDFERATLPAYNRELQEGRQAHRDVYTREPAPRYGQPVPYTQLSDYPYSESRRMAENRDNMRNWEPMIGELREGREVHPDEFFKPEDLQRPRRPTREAPKPPVKETAKSKSKPSPLLSTAESKKLKEKYIPIRDLDLLNSEARFEKSERERMNKWEKQLARKSVDKKKLEKNLQKWEEYESKIPKFNVKEEIKRKKKQANELRKERISEERYGDKEHLREPKQSELNERVAQVLERQKYPPKEQKEINAMRLRERLEEASVKKEKAKAEAEAKRKIPLRRSLYKEAKARKGQHLRSQLESQIETARARRAQHLKSK